MPVSVAYFLRMHWKYIILENKYSLSHQEAYNEQISILINTNIKMSSEEA